MGHHLPRWLEALADRLIPPASGEDVLGDLAECSETSAQYLRNLASVLPVAVLSQIRRRSSWWAVAFNGLVSGFGLLGATNAVYPPFLNQPASMIRLAVPWAVWVGGCVLAAAYGPAAKPSSRSPQVFGATIVATLGASALVGAPVLAVVAGIGVPFGILWTLSMPWVKTKTPIAPLSIDTLPDHARAFQRTIWWRNAREAAAAMVVLVANAPDVWRAENEVARAGHGLLIVGVIFMVYFLIFRAGSRQVPAGDGVAAILLFHRRELARQRDILLDVPRWYLLPFVPGMLLNLASGTRPLSARLLGLTVMAVVFFLVWRLNLWAAKWLDHQLKQADALEEQIQ